MTLNQKEARRQLTSQLYKGSTDNIMNNILRMEKDAETVVSPYFLPSPNQLNKIKANLKKDATALQEVTQLYNQLLEPGPPTREATLSELTRFQFGVLQIKERNKDYTHVEATTVRHIGSILHQIAASIRKEITSALKIQIYKYFMSVIQYVTFPHYGGKDMAFLLARSQTYDCIKKVSRKSDMVQSLLKECAVTVKHKFEVRCHSGFLLDWAMEGRNLKVNRDIVPPHLNDFRHELFTMSWKPIMLFKLDRVCCMNVTPTNMGLVSAHKSSYEEAQDQNGANLLLDFNKNGRGRTRPMNHELRPSVHDGVVHSVTRIPIVGVDSGAGVPVQSIQGNDSSNGHYPLPNNHDHPINTTCGTSKQALTASLPAN